MRTITVLIPAGDTEEFAQSGNYLQVRSSAVDLIIENPLTAEKFEASQGDDFQLDDFKSLLVTNTSGVDQLVKLTISKNKKAGSAKVGGSVNISGTANVAGAVTIQRNAGGFLGNTQKTVLNASTLLDGANGNRRYYAIQNKSTTGTIWVNWGAAATVANGVKLAPGESYEPNFVSLGAVYAIGDIASNPDVVVVQQA